MKTNQLFKSMLATTLIASCLYVSQASLADSRLDQAQAHIAKAIDLLQAAENKPDELTNGNHRLKAIKRSQQALGHLNKAIDMPPPAMMPISIAPSFGF